MKNLLEVSSFLKCVRACVCVCVCVFVCVCHPREALWLVLQKLGVPDSVVKLIKSFHSEMKATVRTDGGITNEIVVENGLRQGCTMAPVLFNLYFGVVVQAWLQRLQFLNIPVGVTIQSYINGNLFSRTRRNVGQSNRVSDFEFADDAVLLATDRELAIRALSCFYEVASEFGLTVNCAKTKFMVVGDRIKDEDCMPMQIADGIVEYVTSFVYLGSEITPDARCRVDVQRRIGSAARAFGALQKVFSDAHLSLNTKRHLFTACVSSVLLYGAESWVTVQADLRSLDTFYHQCIRTVMDINRKQQREEKITSEELRTRWGDPLAMSDKVRVRRLEWLGHLARMDDARLPKSILFGHFDMSRPACGPRQRWKDVVTSDMKRADIPVVSWMKTAQDRQQWRSGIEQPPPTPIPVPTFSCFVCDRCFRRPADRARHKCTAERLLPVEQQAGSVKCCKCERWFCSKGGLAVHRCSAELQQPAQPANLTPQADPDQTCCRFHCTVCTRCFKSRPGFNRHNCQRGQTRISTANRADFRFPCSCGRRFRRQQDLTQHKTHCS